MPDWSKVSSRHGKPPVLLVAAARMHAAGHEFFRSTNGVWLTEHVAPEYRSRGEPETARPSA